MPTGPSDPTPLLSAWGRRGALRPADDGLINRTWILADDQGIDRAVLQWVNPVFPLEVDQDIEAVGAWLAGKGLPTPRVLPTTDGALHHLDGAGGHWRLLSYVPGRTLHRLQDAAQAAQAGALVGRFHAALADWPGPFAKAPRRIHETPARMAELEAALGRVDGHPLRAEIARVGEAILAAWARWEGSLDLPERPCHGDLKVSNLRFDDEGRGLCLLDLDTLGPQRLADELGDAWRSWCNPAGEDDLHAVRFELPLFEASARAWRAAAPAISAQERDSLVPGIERICLELASRFCADTVRDPTYFREDRARYPVRGAHDLHRARAQLALARAARKAAPACEAALRSA